MSWKLEGTYLETCNCASACPCVFLSDPTEGVCDVLVGWHIDHGHDGDVMLDGLNVAFAAHCPGNMITTKWKAAIYLDDAASETQRGSLQKIFGGKAGGHPAALASHVGEVLGVASAPMEFHSEGKRRWFRLGDVGEAEIEQVDGQGGEPITISGHPLAIAPGFPATVARSRKLRYQGYGMTWSEEDKTAFFSPFSYQA